MICLFVLFSLKMIAHCLDIEVLALGRPIHDLWCSVVCFYIRVCFTCTSSVIGISGLLLPIIFQILLHDESISVFFFFPTVVTGPPMCFTDGCRNSLLCLFPDLHSAYSQFHLCIYYSIRRVSVDFQSSSCVILHVSAFPLCFPSLRMSS